MQVERALPRSAFGQEKHQEGDGAVREDPPKRPKLGAVGLTEPHQTHKE